MNIFNLLYFLIIIFFMNGCTTGVKHYDPDILENPKRYKKINKMDFKKTQKLNFNNVENFNKNFDNQTNVLNFNNSQTFDYKYFKNKEQRQGFNYSEIKVFDNKEFDKRYDNSSFSIKDSNTIDFNNNKTLVLNDNYFNKNNSNNLNKELNNYNTISDKDFLSSQENILSENRYKNIIEKQNEKPSKLFTFAEKAFNSILNIKTIFVETLAEPTYHYIDNKNSGDIKDYYGKPYNHILDKYDKKLNK